MTSSFRPISFAGLLTLTIALTSPSRVEAFGGPPGGPFGNGSYFPNEGTFSAVVRGENLAGTLQFSTTSDAGPVNSTTANGSTSSSGTGGVGSTGVSAIYYNGDTLIGNSQGTFDPANSTMNLSFQAGAQGQGEGSADVKTPVETLVNLPLQGPDGGITGYVSSIETKFEVTQQIKYFDSLFFSGYAECKTSNAFPNQKFKGNGKAEFQFLDYTALYPILNAVSMPITVSGVRLSNSSSAFASKTVRPPSVTEISVLVE